MSEVTSPRDRWFYSAMALVLVALVLAGFTPTFFGRAWLAASGSLQPVVVVHGVIGSAWVLLFAVQAALVAKHRVEWHRRMGAIGALLTAAFVVSGVVVIARFEQSHGAESHGVLAAHLFTNGAPLLAFALFAGAGIGSRRVAARHKRLMLLAAVVLLPPAIGRLFGYLELERFNLLAYACLAFANAVYDVATRGRPHAISLLGATALVGVDVTTTWWLAAVGS